MTFFRGGIARFDELAQFWPRLAAVISVGLLVSSPAIFLIRRVRWPLIFVGIAATLVALQLIPLPPALWTALPGRTTFALLASAMSIDQPWRPGSLTPDRTWNALVSLSVPAAVLYAIGHLDADGRRKVLYMVLAMVVGSSFLGLLQLSSGDMTGFQLYSDLSNVSAGGAFANRNHQALFVAIGLPVLAIAAFDQRQGLINGQLRLWLASAIATLLILTIPTTGSRAGLAVGALGLAAALAFAWNPAKRSLARLPRRHRTLIASVAGLSLAAVVALALSFARSESMRRLFSENIGHDRRFQARDLVTQIGMEYFPAGSGFGSFDPVYRQFEPTMTLTTSYSNQAHNEYAQIWIEGGLLGILILLAAIIWFVIRTMQVFRANDFPEVRLGRLGAVIIGMTFVAAAVDYPTRTPIIMALIAVAAAWLECGVARDGSARVAVEPSASLPSPNPYL